MIIHNQSMYSTYLFTGFLVSLGNHLGNHTNCYNTMNKRTFITTDHNDKHVAL